MTKNKNKGFTIVELVIVIAVIAVLAAVLIPTFSGIVEKANESAALQRAVSAYKEAYALALSDDGIISTADNTNNQVDGFTFTWANDGTCTVGTPGNFNYNVTVSGGKVSVNADGSTPNPNPGGNTPPAQGGENEGEGGNNEPQQPAQPAAPKVLYAIGDSITNGSGADNRWTIQAGWLKYVVTEENGFDTVNSKNLGISGLGFVHKDHNYDLTARDVIENSDALQAAGDNNPNKVDVSAKFGDYDLSKADVITVALGVNDWKDNNDEVVKLTDYFTEMEYCLRKIRELNSTCEIYYILPFNTSVVGTYDTNYAYGTAGDNNAERCYSLTLQEFKNRIRAELEGDLASLNIEIIEIEGLSRDDLLKYKNGDTDALTGDGLHPNAAGYAKIGAELAAALTASGN